MRKKKTQAIRLIVWCSMLLLLFPFLILLLWAFVDRWIFPSLLPTSFSLRGFHQLCSQHCYALGVLWDSVVIALLVGVLSALVGVMTARAITVHSFVGQHLVSYVAMLPLLVPVVAVSMGVHVLFLRVGLSDTVGGVILIHVICAIPYSIKMMSEAFSAVGTRLEEAAQTLGCHPKQGFFLVTLPVLSPSILSAVFMGYIVSMNQYFLTLLMGGGRVQTVATLMVPYLQSGDRTLSSSYSLVLIASTGFIFVLADALRRTILPYRSPLMML